MTSIIVGDVRDSHVASVLEAVVAQGGEPPVVIDAPRLQGKGFSLDLDRVICDGQEIAIDPASRGWLRRYAPTAWGTGSVAGSLEAVTKRAFLALIGGVARLGEQMWLTPLDAMLGAEDRLLQLKVARSLGLRVPTTIVTSEPTEAAAVLGERFVVKPLTGGYYWKDGEAHAVFATELSLEAALAVDFGAAPFVAQERVAAVEHLRVVTVRDEAWVGSLSAAGRPLDWRQQDEAHMSWEPTCCNEVIDVALRLTGRLGIGYSSQDWLRDTDGLVFLDLNPGGQWLFLPPEVADPVTRAIARFLAGATP